MDEPIVIPPENIEIIDSSEYSSDVATCFSNVPDVARPLVRGAQAALQRIEQMLYSAPAFINMIKASVPEETFRAILTDEQKAKLAAGTLKLMTNLNWNTGQIKKLTVQQSMLKFQKMHSLYTMAWFMITKLQAMPMKEIYQNG